jgi:hypothetical protein
MKMRMIIIAVIVVILLVVIIVPRKFESNIASRNPLTKVQLQRDTSRILNDEYCYPLHPIPPLPSMILAFWRFA